MDRVIKASAAGIILCGIAFGFVVASRIDQSTITLLVGALVGIAVGGPCVGAMVWLVMRSKVEDERVKHRALQMHRMDSSQPWQVQQPTAMPDPAMIMAMMMQQRMPSLPQQPQAFLPRPRQFYTIGDNGEPKQLTDGSDGWG